MRWPLIVVLTLGLTAVSTDARAQPAGAGHAGRSPWTALSGRLPATAGRAPLQQRVRSARGYALDRSALADQLADAPRHGIRRSATIVTLPAPGGTLERFRIIAAPVMEAGPARDASGFEGYAGVGVDDPSLTARIDTSILGAHASVRSDRGTWFVDPAYQGRTDRYVSYYGRDLVDPDPARLEREDPQTRRRTITGDRRALPAPGAQVIRRDYRLALASDPSYATAIDPVTAGATLDAKVTAAKQTLMARVDQVYNDELGVTMTLVANNNVLNFNTATDYSAAYGSTSGCTAAMLNTNQTVVDARIGNANYDIGHLVYGPDGNGGGIAGLGVVGRTGKARGCTGLATAYGDFFAIDYVAHEMGHQFGGNHTFNGSGGACSGNRAAGAAVEPGSGSSIMAYAGICATDDLQPHSDPYFSERSIQEIQTYVTGTIPTVGTLTTQANRSPVVTAPAANTIPPRTPFTLTASATDADDDTLVYTWEQNDTGATSALVSNAKPSGPLFRQFGAAAYPTANTPGAPSPGENAATTAGLSRTFPDAAQVAAGNTDAATGSCPAAANPPTAAQVECYSEFLPTSARTMNFRLEARDRYATGGGVSSADVAISVSGTQPFAVTSQPTAAAAAGNTTLPVTWSVAGTDTAPVSVANVKISFSTDGGLTFPLVLAASSPNDGSETVTVPNLTTSQGRIKVEAVGNYFFDVSDGNLSVTPSAGPTVTPTPTPTATATPAATPTSTVTASPTTTANPTTTPNPTTTATAVVSTATPNATSTASPTATATAYVLPTATPTPIVIVDPRVLLRPDLGATKRKLKVSSRRTFKVRVRCRIVSAGLGTPVCVGRVRLFAKRRVAIKGFSVAAGKTRTVKLKLSRSAFARLTAAGRLKGKLKARASGQTAVRRVTLRR